MNNILVRTKYLVFSGIVLLLFSSFNKGNDKCDKQFLMEKAIPKLKKYTLIQDFPFSFKKKKKSETPEYVKSMITLNRGVRYRFYAVRNEEYEGIPIVTIYYNEKQDFIIASTYNAGRKVFYDELEFECKATGNYFLSLSFYEGKEGCALGVFAANVIE